MHKTVIDYLKRLKGDYPDIFSKGRIFEAGASNQTVRDFFDNPSEYVGVDWRKGKGIDVASLIHEYKESPDGYFDVAVSTSTFEHDPYWKRSIRRMMDLVGESGVLIITVAGPDWAPHEGHPPTPDYYLGLGAIEIVSEMMRVAWFETIQIIERGDIENFMFFRHLHWRK